MNSLLGFSLAAFTASFLLVLVAEMGDKTQFIAMSFATKYNPYKVLLGVFLATIANFSITVVLGQLLTTVVPIDVISLAASISFIGFGFWTLRPEKSEAQPMKASRLGVVGAVAVPFFIAEFGDKTQLATLSLAAEYGSALTVLVGATLAMLVADGLGIGIGIALGKHIPQRTIKWISASIFVVFGMAGLYEGLLGKIGLAYTVLVLASTIVLYVLVALFLIRKRKS